MADTIRIALAQLNPHLGDLRGNTDRIRAARTEAARLGADLLVTPEFSIAGYPPEDLILKPAFNAAAAEAIGALAAETADGGPGIVLGGPWVEGGRRYNALFVVDGGRIIARRAKHELPNYGVFDDKRVFDAGPAPGPIAFRGFRLGLMIGEDWWSPEVAETLAESGAELLVSINASPFERGKPERRIDRAVPRVVETGLGFVFLGQLGGQDGLVFDGASFVLNPDRSLAVQLPLFEEAVTLTEWHRADGRLVCAPQRLTKPPCGQEQLWRAMMLGLRDHLEKNRFPGVVLGLSGGLDSALSATIAVDALGPDRVRAVMLPSPGTGREKLQDAATCAALLGIRYESIDIGPAIAGFRAMLASAFTSRPAGATEADIQPRTRDVTLMALANASGEMVLATGNKTELAVGCAPLHGDYSVLKDLYKTQALALGHWRNAHLPAGARGPLGPVMPERVITSASSARLRLGQEHLPPYAVLDAILEALVEREADIDTLVAEGHDRAMVLRVWRMLDGAEYKRRQAPPGVKLGPHAFGRDRRYPITNGYTNFIA